MLRVIVSGYSGKMGQVVCEICKEEPDTQVVAGIARDVIAPAQGSRYATLEGIPASGVMPARLMTNLEGRHNGEATFSVFSNAKACDVSADVIIDFSNPEALTPLLEMAVATHTPIVVCTTGIGDKGFDALNEAAKDIAVFYAANMSLGVNLLAKLVKEAATLYHKGFDIEIVEKHHSRKLDAPSGTALLLADAANTSLGGVLEYTHGRHNSSKRRAKEELGIHALRGGTIVGEHSVLLAGDDEVIELRHSAISKAVFARGALAAARFVATREAGLFGMEDLLA